MTSSFLSEQTEDPFCQQYVLPFRITAILIELIRKHFSQPEGLLHKHLKDLLYRSPQRPVAEQAWNAVSSCPRPTIFIDSLLRWEPARVEHRPAILVGEGDYQAAQISLGDGQAPKARVPWGEEPRNYLLQGQHKVICLGTGRQVSLLAQEVLCLLIQFAQEIRQLLHAQKFLVRQMSAPFAVREATDLLGIALTLEVVLVHSWVVSSETPLIESYAVRLTDNI